MCSTSRLEWNYEIEYNSLNRQNNLMSLGNEDMEITLTKQFPQIIKTSAIYYENIFKGKKKVIK